MTRLIDADKLYPDCLTKDGTLAISQSQIANAQTVEYPFYAEAYQTGYEEAKKERPFENIIPVPNIRVGYFEKEAYLEVIDKQEKQIESFAYQIMALQSRSDTLEKSQRPTGKWVRTALYGQTCIQCNQCGKADFDIKYDKYCPNCGADMRGEG